MNALLPDRFRDVETVPAWQHDVKDDHVERLARGALHGGVTVSRGFDAIAFGNQPVRQGELQAWFIFDQEDAGCRHASLRVIRSGARCGG